jgi:hypothetical protein
MDANCFSDAGPIDAGCAGGDAGSRDGGPGPTSSPSKGCGCSTIGGGTTGFAASGVGLLAAAAALRRRRRA